MRLKLAASAEFGFYSGCLGVACSPAWQRPVAVFGARATGAAAGFQRPSAATGRCVRPNVLVATDSFSRPLLLLRVLPLLSQTQRLQTILKPLSATQSNQPL